MSTKGKSHLNTDEMVLLRYGVGFGRLVETIVNKPPPAPSNANEKTVYRNVVTPRQALNLDADAAIPAGGGSKGKSSVGAVGFGRQGKFMFLYY